MSGFGRKGLAAGQTAPQQARSFGGSASRATPRAASTRGAAQPGGINVYSSTEEAEEVSRKREAFLNEERERRIGAHGEADALYQENYPAYAEARYRSERSLSTAYIIWFFLGGFSAHHFYLRRMQSGAIQLSMFFIALALLLGFDAESGEGVGGASLGLALMVLRSLWVFFVVFLIRGMHSKSMTA